MILFFSRWPELFVQDKILIVKSPMYVFTKNKGKKTEERIYCYTKEEYEEKREKYKNYECRFIKGLGSLRSNTEYKDVLDNVDKWQIVKIDNEECLKIMFSDDVEGRRKIMGYEQ